MAVVFNILRPRQDGRHFVDDIFKCILLNEDILISINISLKFLPRGQLNNFPAWPNHELVLKISYSTLMLCPSYCCGIFIFMELCSTIETINPFLLEKKRRCDVAFMEPMHRNKTNITYLLGKKFRIQNSIERIQIEKIGSAYIYIHISYISYTCHIHISWSFHLGSAYLHIVVLGIFTTEFDIWWNHFPWLRLWLCIYS